MWSEHRFLAADRTPIFFRHLGVSGPAKGAVLLVHGMGEHGGRYREFAEYLAERGFAFYIPDLRGFGQSGGGRGCLQRFTDYFTDLDALRRLMDEREGRGGHFYMGHSYGGLVVSSFLAERPDLRVRGLILSSPNFGITLPVPPWRHALARIVSGFLPAMTQPTQVDRATLTHDASRQQQHRSDPLIHDRISARLYTELTERIGLAGRVAPRLSMPVLLLQAGDDRVVSRQAAERFYGALSSTDKKLKVYEGLYHEILNETSRREVYADIAAWMLPRAV